MQTWRGGFEENVCIAIPLSSHFPTSLTNRILAKGLIKSLLFLALRKAFSIERALITNGTTSPDPQIQR